MIPKFIENNKYLSLRCPLSQVPYADQITSESGWTENEEKLPAKLRCKGFRGVLMMMGLLVYVSEEGSSQSIAALVPKDKLFLEEGKRLKNLISFSKKVFPNSFSVPLSFFRKG